MRSFQQLINMVEKIFFLKLLPSQSLIIIIIINKRMCAHEKLATLIPLSIIEL